MKNKQSVPEGLEDFQKLGAELVHDIATPLASLQLNVQSLANYLPLLLDCYEKSFLANHDSCQIPPTQLAALAGLPASIEGDVQKLRSLSKGFLIKIAGTESSTSPPWERMSMSERARLDVGQRELQGTGAPITKPLRLLLVEDEAVHRDIVLQQLSAEITVDCAANGQEALAKSRLNHYDLVLLDFFLPGMDAPTLLNRLKPLLSEKAHIIGFSNLPADAGSKGLYAQVSGCLDKPFRLENFLQVLQTLPSAPESEVEGNEK